VELQTVYQCFLFESERPLGVIGRHSGRVHDQKFRPIRSADADSVIRPCDSRRFYFDDYRTTELGMRSIGDFNE